ncbi:hypothetical protein AXF42_Ash009239 [Apostasia shenzhenica]|uniref:DUF4283 domain-containing protein n=1 Tax=Apostasia shenzhenica TaxID=1088818 RepID=A0A2I0B3J4_9ASPA|nr:hypothetical protein AXF42_Ash009239 [Apostasia shenzhenica]
MDAELDRLAKPLDNMAVGKFSLYRPSMSEIRKFFNSLHLLGNFSLGLYDQKHILIHFSDERDVTRVLIRGSYFVNKNPLQIWKWEVGFRPDQESSLTPVWLSFPGLPVEFWGSLKSLASIFGNPFHVDRSTLNFSRPSLARILVDLDAKKQYSDKIYISVNGKMVSPRKSSLKRNLIIVTIASNSAIQFIIVILSSPTLEIHLKMGLGIPLQIQPFKFLLLTHLLMANAKSKHPKSLPPLKAQYNPTSLPSLPNL